jgi:hypothetical protein
LRVINDDVLDDDVLDDDSSRDNYSSGDDYIYNDLCP